MTNEEALKITERASRILFAKGNQCVQFNINLTLTVGLIGHLQLAFRHPENNGPTRRTMERFVLDLIEQIDPAHGDVYKFLMIGFNGRFDDLPIEEIMPRHNEVSPLDLDWENAYLHFDGVRKTYEALVNVPGVNTKAALELVFKPLAERYENGERSEELYNEMMAVE